jgi:dimethylaniline monooxygenase (N-oxide forming)
MARGIVEQERARDHAFRPLAGRIAELVDHTAFCDALADRIGCKPTRALVARESRAFRRRFDAGPFVAAQYRLTGPHARPELARAVIEALPVAHPATEVLALRLRWALSRLLRRWRGPAWGPKLELPG